MAILYFVRFLSVLCLFFMLKYLFFLSISFFDFSCYPWFTQYFAMNFFCYKCETFVMYCSYLIKIIIVSSFKVWFTLFIAWNARICFRLLISLVNFPLFWFTILFITCSYPFIPKYHSLHFHSSYSFIVIHIHSYYFCSKQYICTLIYFFSKNCKIGIITF